MSTTVDIKSTFRDPAMSTSVDIMANMGTHLPAQPRMKQKDADATRFRILQAAKVRFSQSGYDGVGVREIAAEAGSDPALIMRYFGSKEGLFRDVAAAAFSESNLFDGAVEQLPERAVELLLERADTKEWRQGYDPFRFLLCSIGSVTAGPIVSEAFRRAILDVLARSLEGQARETRAALICSYVLGFALMRVAVPSLNMQGRSGELARERLKKAMRKCIEA